jgi:hypothetical protein
MPTLRTQSQRIFNLSLAIATEAAVDSLQPRRLLYRFLQAFIAGREIANRSTFAPH